MVTVEGYLQLGLKGWIGVSGFNVGGLSKGVREPFWCIKLPSIDSTARADSNAEYVRLLEWEHPFRLIFSFLGCSCLIQICLFKYFYIPGYDSCEYENLHGMGDGFLEDTVELESIFFILRNEF